MSALPLEADIAHRGLAVRFVPEADAAIPLFGCNISLGVSIGLFCASIALAPICSLSLLRATVKVGALLNSQRLVVNVTNDMRSRL
jgi:hypothetical protein